MRNIIIEVLKPTLLVEELKALNEVAKEFRFSSHERNVNEAVIMSDIINLETVEELKQHLCRGGGIEEHEVGNYIGDLYFEITHQYN